MSNLLSYGILSAIFTAIIGFASYGVSMIMVHEDGPWDMFPRLRGLTKAGGEMDKLLACAICVSFWIGFFMTVSLLFVAPDYPPLFVILTWLGSTGVSGLLIRNWHPPFVG